MYSNETLYYRLQLEISYNWQFIVSDDQKEAAKLFAVSDFIGDLCKALASKIRGAVSSVTFDHFHKNSASIIQEAVFGKEVPTDAQGQQYLMFPANNLKVTSVDIK